MQSDKMTGPLSRKDIMGALAELHVDTTQQVILDAALRSLEQAGELTARAAAREAGISERTVFRHFASREELLGAAAQELMRVVRTPAPPASVEELRAFPRALFTAFEGHRELIRAAWHSELRAHIIANQAKQRWVAIRKVIDGELPRASEQRRKIAAALIRYQLSATTWHYYRFVFRFSLEDSIEAAETVVRQQLAPRA